TTISLCPVPAASTKSSTTWLSVFGCMKTPLRDLQVRLDSEDLGFPPSRQRPLEFLRFDFLLALVCHTGREPAHARCKRALCAPIERAIRAPALFMVES